MKRSRLLDAWRPAVGHVVTLMALVLGTSLAACCPHPGPSPTTLERPTLPDEASSDTALLDADDVAVFSQVLKLFDQEPDAAGAEEFLISELTKPCSACATVDHPRAATEPPCCEYQMKGLPEDLWKAFAVRNRESKKLPRFQLHKPMKFVLAEQDPIEMEGSPELLHVFPGTKALVLLSLPAYNQERTEAVTFGEGRWDKDWSRAELLYLLKSKDGRWRIHKRWMLEMNFKVPEGWMGGG